MKRLALLGAALAIVAVALWVRLAGDRPQDIEDYPYPPPGDPYLFDRVREVRGLTYPVA